MAKLSAIHIYPVKSMGAQPLKLARVCPEGLAGDRRFMVIKPSGDFITARTHPMLQLITPKGQDEDIHAGRLRLSYPGQPDLALDASEFEKAPVKTQVWKDGFEALSIHALADAWISTLLGEPARLIWLGETSNRFRETLATRVSFADGYPLLLISEASLADLNLRADAISQMSQFRTNLVVSDTDAFAEDGWKRIRIGEVEFLLAKPCSRCVMTTIIPGTDRFHPLGEPLATLSKFRKTQQGDVNFGQNLIALNEGIIREGDTLEILEEQPSEHYPNRAPAKRSLRLAAKAPIAKDFMGFTFEAADGKPLPTFLPGQHLVFAFDIDGTRHIRRYSLTHAPAEGNYHIGVKRTQGGLISNWLHDELAVGDTVLCSRPEGRFIPKTGKPLLLISAGSGVTPMLAMVRTALELGKLKGLSAPLAHIHFIHQCRSEADIPCRGSLHDFVAAGMTLELNLTAPAPDWQGNEGRINAPQLSAVPGLEERDTFICGPSGFMQTVETMLAQSGVPTEQIHCESFGGLTSVEARAPEQLKIQIGEKGFVGDNQQSLLTQAEAQGIKLLWSCRAGICGSCKCKLTKGEVHQPRAEALSDIEREQGVILACCATPLTDVSLVPLDSV